MDSYITGTTIKTIREAKKLTQAELADQLGVTPKAVSKWETGKGLPDISLLQPLATALDTSIIELMNGQPVINRNRCGNLLRTRFYVCPVCGNILHAVGDAVIVCCGITLPPLEAEEFDPEHALTITPMENEHFITLTHPMTKEHSISFIAYVTGDRVQLVKLYPEGNAETRLSLRGHGILYAYCNHHGLMRHRR